MILKSSINSYVCTFTMTGYTRARHVSNTQRGRRTARPASLFTPSSRCRYLDTSNHNVAAVFGLSEEVMRRTHAGELAHEVSGADVELRRHMCDCHGENQRHAVQHNVKATPCTDPDSDADDGDEPDDEPSTEEKYVNYHVAPLMVQGIDDTRSQVGVLLLSASHPFLSHTYHPSPSLRSQVGVLLMIEDVSETQRRMAIGNSRWRCGGSRGWSRSSC